VRDASRAPQAGSLPVGRGPVCCTTPGDCRGGSTGIHRQNRRCPARTARAGARRGGLIRRGNFPRRRCAPGDAPVRRRRGSPHSPLRLTSQEVPRSPPLALRVRAPCRLGRAQVLAGLLSRSRSRMSRRRGPGLGPRHRVRGGRGGEVHVHARGGFGAHGRGESSRGYAYRGHAAGEQRRARPDRDARPRRGTPGVAPP